MLKKLLVIALSVVALAAAGCGGGDKQAQTTIKVGATAGPHAEVVEAAAKEAAKSGLKVQVVEFSDYVTPDKALADGELDLVSYQHKPFLDNFNKQNKKPCDIMKLLKGEIVVHFGNRGLLLDTFV